MRENIYKSFLAAAMFLFGIYLVTKIKILGAIGGILLIITAFVRVYADWKNGKFKKEKKKKVQVKQRNTDDRN